MEEVVIYSIDRLLSTCAWCSSFPLLSLFSSWKLKKVPDSEILPIPPLPKTSPWMGIKKKRNLFRKVPLCFFRREAALISEVCTPLQESYRMVTYEKLPKELLLQCLFVRHRQFTSAFCSSGSQYPSTVCSRHSFSESVLIFSLSARRLKCSFHDRISLI